MYDLHSPRPHCEGQRNGPAVKVLGVWFQNACSMAVGNPSSACTLLPHRVFVVDQFPLVPFKCPQCCGCCPSHLHYGVITSSPGFGSSRHWQHIPRDAGFATDSFLCSSASLQRDNSLPRIHMRIYGNILVVTNREYLSQTLTDAVGVDK